MPHDKTTSIPCGLAARFCTISTTASNAFSCASHANSTAGFLEETSGTGDLVDDMTLDIPEVRPAVIDRGLARTLGDYLRFRHVFRNVFGGVLEAERMASLEKRLPETLAAFRDRVETFVAWMLEPEVNGP